MRILLTGANGFLGNHLQNLIKKSDYELFTFRSNEFDLRDENETQSLFEKYKPNIVINLAARLGGIGDNNLNPALYFEDNILIGMNVMKNCAIHKVNKLINIGTVCSYPRDLTTPFRESQLWDGYPEGTNSAYGIAKRSLIAYSNALNRQYDLNTINLLLANLYGEGDDFRPETSHVIPAIIRKVDESIVKSSDKITVWGDGTPSRDFLYVKDAATLIFNCISSTFSGIEVGPINLASGIEITINELVDEICRQMKFSGQIYFDKTKPNGQPKRLLDISKSKSFLGFSKPMEFKNGLQNTIEFFYNNRDKILNQKIKYV